MNTQRKIKIVAVFSLIEHANEFYWYAKYLDKTKFDLYCVFFNPTIVSIQKEIASLNIPCYNIYFSSKKNIFSAFIKFSKLLLKIKPNIIHAQLFEASLISLTAAWFLGFKNRIYTRHHADIHHKYHPQAIKYDKWINRLSKKIICPSEQTKNILIQNEKVRKNKIIVIRHGFDFDDFKVDENSKKRIAQNYNITGFPIIGVVSRFTEWKGVHYTIRAFKKILNKHPNALLILAGTDGDYKQSIDNELADIPKNNYRIIQFEKEIYSLFSLFDIFIHVPININSETFGQIYVEAFALGVPCIFTLSGVAAEFDLFEKNAIIVPYQNSEALYQSLVNMIPNLNDYKQSMIKTSMETQNIFNFANKINALESLYLSFFNE